MTEHVSAQPCGCDPGAGWCCSRYPHCAWGRAEMKPAPTYRANVGVTTLKAGTFSAAVDAWREAIEEDDELARMEGEGCPN